MGDSLTGPPAASGHHPPELPSTAALLPSFQGLTPESLVVETELILARSSAPHHDDLAKTLTPPTATFSNLIRPTTDDKNCTSCRLTALGYLSAAVAPGRAIGDAARQAEKRIAAAQLAGVMCCNTAVLLVAVHEKSIDANGETHKQEERKGHLDVEDTCLVPYGEYVGSGAIFQDEARRERFQALQADINELLVAA